jgi:hypothetical protein
LLCSRRRLRKGKQDKQEARAEEAYNILKSYTTKDDCSTHGEHAGNKVYKIETNSSNNGQAPHYKYLVSMGCYNSPTAIFPTSSMHHTETSSSETVSNIMVLTPSPFAENVTADIHNTSRSASELHDTSIVS